ncbi:hypothetical protein [Amycolatopsis sp. YIM 10]|uniref:hypothetical protein n=1 Tax=Amycolatopsis sp. YIM 10 TaxID=2653857 RepID=UPI001D136AFD|nr:hypothetical protein [Amycolatopsis sp. YIM 10]
MRHRSSATSRGAPTRAACSEAGQPRLPRGVRLTDAGAALAERGRAIRRRLRAAQADLDVFARLDRGTLRLGSFPTTS